MKMAVMVAALAIVILAAVSLHGADAATYVVGDAFGWQNPPNSTFYSSWASSHNFTVGDSLLFNFATGVHDVATVTEDAYTNCNTGNPLNIVNTGPANVTLNSTGMVYYICTFAGHCNRNQKLAVNVGGSTSSTPSPPGTTASPPPPPPPPPGSSAASTTAGSFALMLMSLGFMYI
ncbi:umecyanin [Manihot esculenta]|uniref:Phytocyanin domain-containing protein n=1 Tax=Manihot esculenta TaxID=3983 RepID=A0A2C9VPK1_MANES|nr:umecyanin [Manihot esculenta]OAY47159.1 hypothetical protein MANES_06G056801v8 [Manihot esculenta]